MSYKSRKIMVPSTESYYVCDKCKKEDDHTNLPIKAEGPKDHLTVPTWHFHQACFDQVIDEKRPAK